MLTHWGRVTHICVGRLTIIGSDNGLSPAQRQAIIWTNAGILLIGPLETNFSEILIGIQTFPFTKMHLKMASAKWRPFCLGLNMFKLSLDALDTTLDSSHVCCQPLKLTKLYIPSEWREACNNSDEYVKQLMLIKLD